MNTEGIEISVENIIKTLKCQQRNTVEDTYDNGFYNGIEVALSILENREPVFRAFKKDEEKCNHSINGKCTCIMEDDSLSCEGAENEQGNCAIYVGYSSEN